MKNLIWILLFVFSQVTSGYAQTTYYVDDLSGSDTNTGNSIHKAWKNIDRLN